MISFTWRGFRCSVKANELVLEPYLELSGYAKGFTFPCAVRHAHAMDQNVIVVLLEDGNLWQCGAVPTAKLVPNVPPPTVAAAAG